MISGNIKKMTGKIENNVVNYLLPIGNENFNMNTLIGKNIKMTFNGEINCVHCKKLTEKSYNSGYCKECNEKLAETDLCHVSPTKCSFNEGGCRDESWGLEHCFKNHLVYLSCTGDNKVGITRHSEGVITPRWIDQGATSGIPLMIVNNRLLSGRLEEIIKEHIGDKTNWRKMLSFVKPNDDLSELAKNIKSLIKNQVDELQKEYGLIAIQWVEDPKVQHINYPVIENGYPKKVNSINLDKTPVFEGKLTGIKGQYLIFENDLVINLRKYSGYNLSFIV